MCKKNKLFAIVILFLGTLSVLLERDVTFFLFALIIGITLFFSRENYIYGRDSMSRAEIRRAKKKERKEKTATYNFTRKQLDDTIREKFGEELRKAKQEASEKAVNTAMVLLLTLPLEVLMDHYWKKSYAARIPKFTNYILEYYAMWENGELDMEELKKDLWEYGGVRLEEEM